MSSTWTAFDTFIGFMYAASISLVIRTVYAESRFRATAEVFCTLIILGYFAFDWLAKYFARHQIPEDTTRGTHPYIILAVELVSVYFLLLVALKLVELLVPPTGPWDLAWSRNASRLLAACFGICTWAWNMSMIWASRRVNWEQIRTFLFQQHLDNAIVKDIPRIGMWTERFQNRFAQYRTFGQRLESLGQSEQTDAGTWTAKQGRRKARLARWRALLVSIAWDGPHLLVAYLLVTHIIALNLILGGLIIVSVLVMGGHSILAGLLGIQPFAAADFATLAAAGGLLVIFACAGCLLGTHYAAQKDRTPYERVGCACLFLAILAGYLMSPALALVVLLILQQIFANILMTLYYRPRLFDKESVDEVGA